MKWKAKRISREDGNFGWTGEAEQKRITTKEKWQLKKLYIEYWLRGR